MKKEKKNQCSKTSDIHILPSKSFYKKKIPKLFIEFLGKNTFLSLNNAFNLHGKEEKK